MLCADFLDTLYKLKINRTFIEQLKKLSIKKDKKMYILFTWKIP